MNNPYTAPQSNINPQLPDVDLSKVPMVTVYVIYLGIIGGILFYAGFVLSKADQAKLTFNWGQTKWSEDWLFLAVMSAASFAAPLIVPKLLSARIFAQKDIPQDRAILGLFQTQFIVGIALLDMCAFLFIFRFSISSNLAFLVLAGIAITLIALRFPSRNRLRAWWDRNSPQMSHANFE